MAIPIAEGFPEEPCPADDGATSGGPVSPRFEMSWRTTWSIVGMCLVLVAVVALFLMRIAVPA